MAGLGTPRISTISDKPKARGAGQPPRKYTKMEWFKGYLALVLLSPLWLICWCLQGRTLPVAVTRKLLRWHQAKTARRKYDVRIPGILSTPAYMLRWWHWNRNAYFNCYLHRIYRSDSDLALHDHPWWSFSIVLDGGYTEHSIAEGGIHKRKWFGPGAMQFRWKGSKAHRLELKPNPNDSCDDEHCTLDNPKLVPATTSSSLDQCCAAGASTILPDGSMHMTGTTSARTKAWKGSR